MDDVVPYSTRHLRVDLRDRLRVLAALGVRGLREMEDVLNVALEIGVRALEQESLPSPEREGKGQP